MSSREARGTVLGRYPGRPSQFRPTLLSCCIRCYIQMGRWDGSFDVCVSEALGWGFRRGNGPLAPPGFAETYVPRPDLR